MKILSFLYVLFLLMTPHGWAQPQTYEELLQQIRVIKDPAASQVGDLNKHQIQVRQAWQTGKLIDDYLLERNQQATELVNKLAADLKDDPSRLYYTLQFVRTYPDSAPAFDLPWGFYQYLLAINDPRERNNLANRAVSEKWNWATLRKEVQIANRDNKEFVFTAVPGRSNVYRLVKAEHGPYRNQLVLDLGFGNYYKLPYVTKFRDYDIVHVDCDAMESCVLMPASEEAKNLFTYQASVIKVTDGDTFQAIVDLGFKVTTRQTFRLWGLDAPEINTREGRAAKKVMEELLIGRRVTLRAMRIDKYGRYLTDVWTFGKKQEPLYVNQILIDRHLAEKQERATH